MLFDKLNPFFLFNLKNVNCPELFSNGTEASNPLLPAYIAYTSLSLCSIVLGR